MDGYELNHRREESKREVEFDEWSGRNVYMKI
jgi:hypothetical protein